MKEILWEQEKIHIWRANEIVITEEGTYIVRMYIHNNNPNGYDAIAEDVCAHVTLPLEIGRTLGIQCSIDSSNASPTRYWDGVNFKSNQDFYIDYVEGSARYENNGIGSNGGCHIKDSLITSSGVLLGYDKLDGKVPGGLQYDAYLSFKVRVIFVDDKDDTFLFEPSVRNVGEKSFNNSTEVHNDDEIQYQIYYENRGNTLRQDVRLLMLPSDSLKYIKGSVTIYNVKYPSGVQYDNDSITSYYNLGNYAPNSNAYIRAKFKVVNTDKINDGETINLLVKIDDGTIEEYKSVDVIYRQ